MFDLARYHAPSTIFLDELDALASKRDGGSHSTEHEGSRRLKTELLIQLDGLSQTEDQVFFLCTSNFPWYIKVNSIVFTLLSEFTLLFKLYL